MKKILLCLLALSLVAGFTACAQPLSAGEFIQSDKPRDVSTHIGMLPRGSSSLI